MFNWIQKAALALTLCVGLGAHAADTPPDELLKQVTDEVVTLIKTDHDLQVGDRQKAFAVVDGKIAPHFDFVRMTRLALGKNWAKATPEQQTQVVEAFRSLLVHTYSSALTRFRNQQFTYKPWTGNAADQTTTVQSVVSDGSHNTPVDYAMARADGTWKVYDIKVEGISLVTNYRSDFNDRIVAGGIDGLIKDLQDKARAAETAKPGDVKSPRKS